MRDHTPTPAPETELTAALAKRTDDEEILKIATARKVVAERVHVLKQQLAALS